MSTLAAVTALLATAAVSTAALVAIAVAAAAAAAVMVWKLLCCIVQGVCKYVPNTTCRMYLSLLLLNTLLRRLLLAGNAQFDPVEPSHE